MPTVTETAFLKLKPDLNPEDPDSATATQLKRFLAITARQPGFLRQYWGVEIEDPTIVVFSVDWTDVQDHHNFMNSDDYKTLIGEAVEIFDLENPKPIIFHTQFTSEAAAAREAPVTEVNYFNLPSATSKEQEGAFEDAIMGVAKVATTVGTCSAFAVGWVMEKMENDTDPAGEALVFNVVLGWPSVEDHIKVTKTDEFVKARTPLASMVKPVKAFKNMRHVKFHATK